MSFEELERTANGRLGDLPGSTDESTYRIVWKRGGHVAILDIDPSGQYAVQVEDNFSQRGFADLDAETAVQKIEAWMSVTKPL